MKLPNLGDRAPGRAVCSLASLLLLMTLAVVITAALRMGALEAAQGQGDMEELVATAIGGLIFGAIAGSGMAASREEGIFGTFLCFLAGMGFGTVGALLIAMPASMPVLAAGSVVLVAGAATVRYFSRSRDEPAEDDAFPELPLPPGEGRGEGSCR
jgi:hypothetical protein